VRRGRDLGGAVVGGGGGTHIVEVESKDACSRGGRQESQGLSGGRRGAGVQAAERGHGCPCQPHVLPASPRLPPRRRHSHAAQRSPHMMLVSPDNPEVLEQTVLGPTN
jgi:hypothetical protein